MPWTPIASRAVFTSSSLNGLSTAVTSLTTPPLRPGSLRSQGLHSSLSRADPDDLVDRGAPHLAVADRPGLRRLRDHFDDVERVGVVDQHLDAHLPHARHGLPRAAVDLGVPALATVALHLADGH